MEAPKLPTVFKQNRPRAFGFKPRYYDARKERIEEMRKKYSEDKAGGALSSRMKGAFRDKMREEWQNNRSKANTNANLRLVAILVLLFAIAWKLVDFFELI